METNKTRKLTELFDGIVEALEANDLKKVAELEFMSQSIQDSLSPAEKHTHMLYYINMVTGLDQQAIIEDVYADCGSYDPVIQNEHIEARLATVTKAIEEDNDAAGYVGYTTLMAPPKLQ